MNYFSFNYSIQLNHLICCSTLDKMSTKVVLFLFYVVIFDSFAVSDKNKNLDLCNEATYESNPPCRDFLKTMKQPEWVEDVHLSCFDKSQRIPTEAIKQG